MTNQGGPQNSRGGDHGPGRPRSRTRPAHPRRRRTVLDGLAIGFGALCLLAAVASAISILTSAYVGDAAAGASGSWQLRRLLPLIGSPVTAVLGGWALRAGIGRRPAGRLDVALAIAGLVIALRMAMWADGYGWFGISL